MRYLSSLVLFFVILATSLICSPGNAYGNPGGGSIPEPVPNYYYNVWKCECLEQNGIRACEMNAYHNPHLQGEIVYWYDGLCIIPDAESASHPTEWACEDATPHHPSCF